MNQIEIWFGILMSKVIKRGNFLPKNNLKNKILAFMDYEMVKHIIPYTG